MILNLPENWIKINLPELCNITTGKWDANHSNPNGKYRFYTCSSEYSFSETASFNGKSIIVPGNGDIGLVFFYDGEFEAYQRTYVLNNIKINPLFLFYHFKFAWRSHNSDKQFGSTVKYVRIGNFENYEIPLPPLAEQGRIVQKIEELFADIDAGIQNLKSVQNQIKLYCQSVLKSAFEGNLYKSSEWKIVSIQHITLNKKNAVKAGPFGSALKKDTYTKNGYKIYGQEQVIRGDAHFGDYYISKEKYNELYSCHVKPKDILISLVGTIGKVLILPEDAEDGIINPRLIKISLDPQKYLTKFFKFYFESVALKSQYKKEAHGQTMEVLNLGLIKKLSFPLPSLGEQERIVAEIEKRFERADELEKAVDTALADAEKMKQAVLKKAFRGELVPQNPDDEPAAVLLDRIRAERAAAPKSPKKGKRK